DSRIHETKMRALAGADAGEPIVDRRAKPSRRTVNDDEIERHDFEPASVGGDASRKVGLKLARHERVSIRHARRGITTVRGVSTGWAAADAYSYQDAPPASVTRV